MLAGCAGLKHTSKEPGFISLFDGDTFAGWEGSREVFRIDDGAVVGGTLSANVAHNDFLCTVASYDDFELRLQCRLLGENANAGIQIRSRRVPDHYEVSGYQADMGQQYWGCLYDESRRNKVLACPDPAKIAEVVRAGDWNDYVIRCEGKRIQLWINGFQTVDYTEAAPNPKFECRSPKQARKPKTRNSKAACGRTFGTSGFVSFEFVSDFGFRASCLALWRRAPGRADPDQVRPAIVAAGCQRGRGPL